MTTREARIDAIYSNNLVETMEEAVVYIDNENGFLGHFQPFLAGGSDEEYWAQVWFLNQEEAYQPDCDTHRLAMAYNTQCRENGGTGFTLRRRQ